MQANKIKINKNKIETTLNLNRKCKTQIGATSLVFDLVLIQF